MRKCENMFDHMPEDFPLKRIMHGIEEIQEQNTRLLSRLEEEQPRRTPSGRGRPIHRRLTVAPRAMARWRGSASANRCFNLSVANMPGEEES
jgi:hypothetical protein